MGEHGLCIEDAEYGLCSNGRARVYKVLLGFEEIIVATMTDDEEMVTLRGSTWGSIRRGYMIDSYSNERCEYACCSKQRMY